MPLDCSLLAGGASLVGAFFVSELCQMKTARRKKAKISRPLAHGPIMDNGHEKCHSKKLICFELAVRDLTYLLRMFQTLLFEFFNVDRVDIILLPAITEFSHDAIGAFVFAKPLKVRASEVS